MSNAAQDFTIDTNTYRFEYNPAIRLDRYGVIALALVFSLVIRWLSEGSLSVAICLIAMGFIVLAIAATELYLLSAKGRVIEVDMKRKELRLERFVYPLRFMDIKPKASVVIPFDKIQTIESFKSVKNPWKSSLVYTDESKFAFNDYFDNTEQLIGLLKEIADETEPIHPMRSMMVLGFAAGLVGLLLVAFLGWLIGWI